MTPDRISRWEELLDEVRGQPMPGDPERGRAAAAFVADWLGSCDDVALRVRAETEAERGSFEPHATLLRLFGRMNRALSDLLYRRSFLEEPPLLSSDFGDWAVGSLAREVYLDSRIATTMFIKGLDLQAMCLLRQMAELAWRALIVAGEPEVADEWWGSIVASVETGERAKLEKQLWQRHFRPAAMLRNVGAIEARLDGLTGEAAEKHRRETIARLSSIYSLLSGTTHGGGELVYASAVRGAGANLPEDPFAELGMPTDLGRRVVSAALYLQTRFWRYFPRAAFRETGEETVPPQTVEGALTLVAEVVERLMERQYARYIEG